MQGRNLNLLKISNNLAITGKPGVWIDGGIHAREWISPSTVTYLMFEFLKNDYKYQDILNKYDLYILPLVNPDGYEFSRTEGNRMWRQNRNWYNWLKGCFGVDLNRNWDTPDWGLTGSSKDPCDKDQIYAGSWAFSEPETRSIRDFIWERKDYLKVLRCNVTDLFKDSNLDPRSGSSFRSFFR